MSKWLDRLGGDFLEPTTRPADKTDKSPSQAPKVALLSVLAAPEVVGLQKSAPATADSPRPYRLPKADADRCHWPPWGEPEIQAFVARVLTFMRRGMSATDADDLAERLTLRDRDADRPTKRDD